MFRALDGHVLHRQTEETMEEKGKIEKYVKKKMSREGRERQDGVMERKVEKQTFKLWHWRRLLRDSGTARNQTSHS